MRLSERKYPKNEDQIKNEDDDVDSAFRYFLALLFAFAPILQVERFFARVSASSSESSEASDVLCPRPNASSSTWSPENFLHYQVLYVLVGLCV
jgi:hypothetical protein